jgi:hypothetical protein
MLPEAMVVQESLNQDSMIEIVLDEQNDVVHRTTTSLTGTAQT